MSWQLSSICGGEFGQGEYFFAGQDNLRLAHNRAPRPDDLNAAHDGGCRRLAAICHRVKGTIDVLGADSKPNQGQSVSWPQNKSPLGQAVIQKRLKNIWATARLEHCVCMRNDLYRSVKLFRS